MFYKNILSLLTGRKAIDVMTLNMSLSAAYFIGSAALSLYQGYSKSKAAKASGEAGRDVAYANAADLQQFAGINADLLLGAADRNAQSQLIIGEANASAIERATNRNLMLYGMQAEEETRRHVYGEKMSAGRIRAMVGAAGVQTNTGTPLMFLYSQVDEGIRQRKFMISRHEQTMWTMAQEGSDKAGITRLTASENAAVIMSNAEAQAEVSILDAARQAAAMERGGDLAQSTGNAQASAAFIGGITNAASAIGSAYSQGAFTSTATSPAATSFSNNWQTAGGWTNSNTIGGSGASAGMNAGGGYLGSPGRISSSFTTASQGWGRGLGI